MAARKGIVKSGTACRRKSYDEIKVTDLRETRGRGLHLVRQKKRNLKGS